MWRRHISRWWNGWLFLFDSWEEDEGRLSGRAHNTMQSMQDAGSAYSFPPTWKLNEVKQKNKIIITPTFSLFPLFVPLFCRFRADQAGCIIKQLNSGLFQFRRLFFHISFYFVIWYCCLYVAKRSGCEKEKEDKEKSLDWGLVWRPLLHTDS